MDTFLFGFLHWDWRQELRARPCQEEAQAEPPLSPSGGVSAFIAPALYGYKASRAVLSAGLLSFPRGLVRGRKRERDNPALFCNTTSGKAKKSKAGKSLSPHPTPSGVSFFFFSLHSTELSTPSPAPEERNRWVIMICSFARPQVRRRALQVATSLAGALLPCLSFVVVGLQFPFLFFFFFCSSRSAPATGGNDPFSMQADGRRSACLERGGANCRLHCTKARRFCSLGDVRGRASLGVTSQSPFRELVCRKHAKTKYLRLAHPRVCLHGNRRGVCV